MPVTLFSSENFDHENKYVTSYLLSPLVLGYVRLLLGIYALITNIVVLAWSGVVLDEADGYFSYFTHLSYVGLIAWFWASGVQSIAFAKAWKAGKHHYPLQSWPRVLQILHELLFSTIATFPFIVTIVYWLLLASSESFSSPYTAWTNISQHILNTPFALFEIICTDVPPLHWVHLPITIFILGLYLGVAYITHATQGFYSYSFLDPKEQGAFLAVYIVAIGAGQAILFIIVRYVIVLRARLTRRSGSTSHSHPMQKIDHEKMDQA